MTVRWALGALAVLVAGCAVEQFGLEYPPGATEILHLSAFSKEERRMDCGHRAAGEGSASFPALFSVSRNERADSAAADVLYPLFSYRRTRDVRETAFRPLCYVKQDPVADRTDAFFIYPLGRYRRERQNRYFTLWPFYWSKQYRMGVHKNEHGAPSPGNLEEFARRKTVPGVSTNLDWALFPIFFGGANTEEGKYFAFFPVGGMVKGLIGKEWIRFVLFPLYLETLDKRYHSWNVLWPLIAWWKGPDQRGWRFFPFYGVNTRDGQFTKKFFLWPLGINWRIGIDTKYPMSVHAFLPFYAHMHNRHLRVTSVLWPLFSRKYDDRRHLVEWHCPWPVFSYTRGDGIIGMKIWPFFGYRASNRQRNLTVLWPLYTRTLSRAEDRTILTRSSCLLFYQWTERRREHDLGGKTIVAPPPRNETSTIFGEAWVDDPRKPRPPQDPALLAVPYRDYERTFWKLWPLCHYRKGADDSKVFQFLSPLPWAGNEGSANTYAPFWTLYRYERDASGQKREYALLGFYHNIRDAQMRDVNVLGVFRYRREGWYYKRFMLLGGLVGYERVGYDRGLRLLWMPVNRIARSELDRYYGGGFAEEMR